MLAVADNRVVVNGGGGGMECLDDGRCRGVDKRTFVRGSGQVETGVGVGCWRVGSGVRFWLPVGCNASSAGGSDASNLP